MIKAGADPNGAHAANPVIAPFVEPVEEDAPAEEGFFFSFAFLLGCSA